MTRRETANIIEAFLDGTGGKWDWDEFTSFPLQDPELERVRQVCISVPDIDPPGQPGAYCGENGLTVLRNLVRDLRAP